MRQYPAYWPGAAAARARILHGWPPATWPVVGVLVLLGLSGPNWDLALLALPVLLVGLRLLWRPGEAPILLFIFAYFWLQSSISIYYANLLGVPIDDVSFYGADMWTATVLTLLAVLAIAVGMRLGAGDSMAQMAALWRAWAAQVPLRLLFMIYLGAFAAAFVLHANAWAVPGLQQIFLALANMKWAFFWLLAYASFVQRAGWRSYFAAAFVLEFLYAFGGFFSEFKTVFIFTLLALVAAGMHFSTRQKLAVLILAAMTITLGIVWSAIKTDYREFLSGGTMQQVVVVGYEERIAKLAELIADMDGNKWLDGLDRLVRRVAYVEFFGITLQQVPEVIPHTQGEIWWDAIRRPFMPRILFPEKSVVNDTELLHRITGLDFSHVPYTSVSLGLQAETYADFGAWLMFVPLLGLGWAAGRMYRYSLRFGPLGMGLAAAALYPPLSALEQSLLKLIPGLVLGFLASLIVLHVVVPRCCYWLKPTRKTA